MRLVHLALALAILGACASKSDREPSERRAREQPRYVGVQRCGECHDAAFAFWNNTPHARAFFALAREHKQADPSCIACHVTGYGKPGGHAGAEPRGLEGVQCEVCHGPGSRHAETQSLSAIARKPERTVCRSCHTPPQVPADWDLDAAWRAIVGPGHGAASER